MVRSKNARLTIMKKILILLLSCLLVLCLPLSALAAEEQGLSSRQISDEELAILYDTTLYNKSLEGVTLTNQPIIRIYPYLYVFEYAKHPIYEMLPIADERANGYFEYLIGNTHIFVSSKEDGIIVGKREDEQLLPFLADIQSMEVKTTLKEIECTILDIYCFNIDIYHGAFVYLITDQGVFVKCYCYDSYSAGYESLVLTEEEFSAYATSYYRHSLNLGKYDGFSTFIKYVQKIYGTSNDYGTRYEQTRTIVTVSAACAAALLVLGVSAFFIVKRRKKQQS